MVDDAGLEFVVDFPTLGDLADAWIEQHCRVPNGFDRGASFRQSDWQFWCTANHYRVREDAVWRPERPLLNQAFVYRRSQVIAPQKMGKGPWVACRVTLHAVGPCEFAGWAKAGDQYRCEDNGCGCGGTGTLRCVAGAVTRSCGMATMNGCRWSSA